MQRYGLRMLHCVVCERGDASLLVSASLLRVDNLVKAKHRGKRSFSRWVWTQRDNTGRQRNKIRCLFL